MNTAIVIAALIAVLLAALWVWSATWQDDDDYDELPDVIRKRKD